MRWRALGARRVQTLRLAVGLGASRKCDGRKTGRSVSELQQENRVKEIAVKMAKADKDDIDKLIAFFQFIDEYFEHGTHTPQDSDVSTELTDESFIEQLRKLWGQRFGPAGVDCAWSRVVFGCDILIDNCCDPNADTLEWKPEIEKLLRPPAEIDDVLSHLRGDIEGFRAILLDKTELLAQFMDYVESVARRKRCQPWSLVGQITSHGSGVASAIYELYRRKSVEVTNG
jgi:hypothetical protein